MPLGLFFGFLSGTLSIVSTTANRLSLRVVKDAVAYSWWFEAIRTLFFFLIIMVTGQELYSINTFTSLIGFGLFEILSVYIFMKMHVLTELSLSSIIVQLRLVWTPIIAYFLLGESLRPSQYLGIGIIFIGAVLVAWPTKFKFDRGILLALIASVITASLGIFMKLLTHKFPVAVTGFWMSLPSLLLLPLFSRHAGFHFKRAWTLSGQGILIAALCNSLSMLLLLYALQRGLATTIMSLYYSLNIMSALVGIVILKERQNLYRKLLGFVCAFVGAIVTVN